MQPEFEPARPGQGRTGTLPLVGRTFEVQRIGACLERARRGAGSVVLVLGDAGIGKTRLAAEATDIARAGGFACAWGDAWPEHDASPLWPWPAIVEQLGGGEEMRRSTERGDSERFSQFRAVGAAIEAAAVAQPVMIVLDDAHAADLGVLLLARFVTRAVGGSPVVFVFTARDGPGVQVDRSRALDDIARDAVVLRPAPLARGDVGELLEAIGRPSAGAALDELQQLTGGNPLLIHELTSTAAFAEGGRSLLPPVLDRRIEQFDAGQREVLTAAAVLGRNATVSTIGALLVAPSSRPSEDMARRVQTTVTAALRTASQAGVVVQGDDGVVTFAHQLLSDALLDRLPSDELAGLHERAAIALGAPSARGGADRLTAVAHHRLAAIGEHATPTADRLAAAAEACEAAAGVLVAELAYESASSLLANTIDRFDRLGLDPPVALMLRLAGAELAAGHLRAARPWFRRAAGVATDPVELAEAAVGLGGIWVHEHRRTVERAAYLALLDRAVRGVESLAVARPDLLVRLRARRAAEHVYTSRWSADRLMVELEAARALGDPLVVAECLSLVHHTMLGPAHAVTRASLADELVAVAAAAGGDLYALLGLMWRTVDFVLSGDSRAVRSLADLVERADALQVAAVSYVADVIGVMNLVRDGRLDDAEAAAEAAFAFGVEIGDADAFGYFGAHLVTVRWLQRREEEVLPLAREVAASPDLVEGDVTFPAALAVVAAATGHADEASTALRRVLARGPASAEISSNWLVSMFCATEAAALLGDVESLQELTDRVRPFAALPVMGSLGVVCLGSAARILGVAADAVGHTDEAIGHFTAALAHNRELGNRPMTAIVAGELALALLRRDAAGDADAGRAYASTAIDALSGMGLDRRAEELRAAVRW